MPTRHAPNLAALLVLASVPALGAARTYAPSRALAAAPAPADAIVVDRGVELLRGLRDPKAPPPEESGRLLAELGPGVVDLLVDVLEERRVPDVQGAGAEPQVLSRPQRATILVALEQLGRGVVMPTFERRFEAPEDGGQRRAAIEVLGAVAEGRELERLFALTLDPETESYDAGLADSLQESVSCVLERDVYGFSVLSRSLGDLDEGQLEAVILGVGRTRDPQGLEVFTSIPWANERHRVLVAAQVPLLGPSNDADLNRELADHMLSEVSAPSENLANAAILALAHLEDFTCVPRLIELLDSPSPQLRASAHHALCTLTAKSTVPSLGVWRHWYRTEEQWSRREGARAVDALLGGTEKEALAALEGIATHRLERHRLALDVGVGLVHRSERVRVRACGVLAGLGSRWAVVPLREALLDPSDAVKEAAHAALLSITGERRDAYYADWEAYPAPDPRSF